MTTSHNSDFVSFSAPLTDQYIAVINSIGVDAAIQDIDDIILNIDHAYEGLEFGDALKQSGRSMQELINEVELALPFYLDLLKPSITEFQSEGHLEFSDLKRLLGETEAEALQLRPKLLVSDGKKAFAYLQIAAYQAKLSDEFVSLWYQILSTMLWVEKSEQLQAPRH